MLSKRGFFVLAVTCALLLVHEGISAQKKSEKRERKSESRETKSESREAKSESREAKSESRETKSASSAHSRGNSDSSRRSPSNSSSNRTAGSNKSGDSKISRNSRDRSSSNQSGWRDSAKRDSARRDGGASNTRNSSRTAGDRRTTSDREWRRAGNAGNERRRSISSRRIKAKDRNDRGNGRWDGDSDGRATINRRPHDRRKPPYVPPAPDCWDYDYCDIIIEEHFWITEINEVIYHPIFIPIGALIPEKIDPVFIARIDSLVEEGLGNDRLVCLLQMTRPFEGYELYEIFEELEDFEVLRKLTDRAFIVHVAAGLLYDIIDHPLVGWIDEYRSVYKYRPDEWDSYQLTFLHLMEQGCPGFVRELEMMGIPLVRTPHPYVSCYCVIVDINRVPELADLWWVYEVSALE